MADYNSRSRRPDDQNGRRQMHPQSSANSARRADGSRVRPGSRAQGGSPSARTARPASGRSAYPQATQGRTPVMASRGRRIGSGGGGRMVSRRQFSAGALAAIAGVTALTVGGGVWYTKRAVACEIDGAQCKAANGSTIKALVNRGLAKPKYGNLVSVADDVLKQGEGNRYTVSVNGVDLGDKIDEYRLRAGDKLVFTNGTDLVEEHESQKQHLPYNLVRAKGAGAIGFISNWGKPGYSEVVRGKISGKTVDRGVVEKPEDRVVTYLNVQPANDEKIVAITFDDGPSNTTLKLMEELAKFNAKATFFEIGNHVHAEGDIDKKLREAGHQVCCHTMTHQQLPKISPERVTEEVVKGRGQLSNVGIETKVFRAPYGAFAMREWEILEDNISALIGWNLDTVDWKKPGTDNIVKAACAHMHPGAIILCHSRPDTLRQTGDAVPQILQRWTDAGYRFVTINELLASDPRFPKEVVEGTVTKPQVSEGPQPLADAKKKKEDKKA